MRIFRAVQVRFTQGSRTSRRHILRELLQGIGLCNCTDGESAGSSGMRQSYSSGQNFFFRKSLNPASVFQLTESGSPSVSKRISFNCSHYGLDSQNTFTATQMSVGLNAGDCSLPKLTHQKMVTSTFTNRHVISRFYVSICMWKEKRNLLRNVLLNECFNHLNGLFSSIGLKPCDTMYFLAFLSPSVIPRRDDEASFSLQGPENVLLSFIFI